MHSLNQHFIDCLEAAENGSLLIGRVRISSLARLPAMFYNLACT
jgi:hypothetical protein